MDCTGRGVDRGNSERGTGRIESCARLKDREVGTRHVSVRIRDSVIPRISTCLYMQRVVYTAKSDSEAESLRRIRLKVLGCQA